MSRGPAAALLVLSFASSCGVAARGPCVFNEPDRVITLSRLLQNPPVARRGEGGNHVLLFAGPEQGDTIGLLRVDLITGQTAPDSMPYDASGRSWPVPGYTFFSGSILAPADPLVQHGIVRTELSEERTLRVLFGRRTLVEQRLPTPEHRLEGVAIEPDGDRILCFCNDSRGMNIAVFSRAKLTRAEPAAAGIERLASFDNRLSDRGEDDNGDGFFDAIVVTPRIRVTKPGRYRIRVRLRNANRDSSMGLSNVDLAESAEVPVRFDAKLTAEAIGDPPYDIFAIEVGQDTSDGEMLLDQRFHVGRTRDYAPSELQSGFVTATGNGSVEPVDADGDGRFERLRVAVELQFARAGEHAISASLRDAARRSADAASIVQPKVTPGQHTITLEFSGAAIARASLSGALTLRLVVYGPATPVEIERAFVTRPFAPSDFE